MARKKLDIDEWMEVIDTIYSDKQLEHEFGYLKDKSRDEVVKWAREHGFRHTIILRLVTELKKMLHYRYLEICYQNQILLEEQVEEMTRADALGTVAETSGKALGTVAKDGRKRQESRKEQESRNRQIGKTEKYHYPAFVLKHEVRGMFFQQQEEVVFEEEKFAI